jgi:hypothetical protein
MAEIELSVPLVDNAWIVALAVKKTSNTRLQHGRRNATKKKSRSIGILQPRMHVLNSSVSTRHFLRDGPLVGIYAIIFGVLVIIRAFQLRSWAASVAAPTSS